MIVDTRFHLMETTLDDVQAAFEAGELSSKELVEMYLACRSRCPERGAWA
jgi:hypothetical protein